MGINAAEFQMLHDLKRSYKVPDGANVAILGNCAFRYAKNASVDTFVRDMPVGIAETFDVLGNPTHRVNLNHGIDGRYKSRYDWVIDAGTACCCFDVAQVFQNMVSMLRPRGLLLSWSSMFGYTNRCYYSFHPSFYIDFLLANGFGSILTMYKTKASGVWKQFDYELKHISSANQTQLDFSQRNNFTSMVPNDTQLLCAAVRESLTEFAAPIPSHYIATNGM